MRINQHITRTASNYFILAVILFSMSTQGLAETENEGEFANLLEAYNEAGQHYLFELQTDTKSTKTNWQKQYSFYKNEVNQTLDHYNIAVNDDSSMCQEALNIFSKYLSNEKNPKNVSVKISREEINQQQEQRLEQIKNNYTYGIDPFLLSAGDTYFNTLRTNTSLSEYESLRHKQYKAITDYCKLKGKIGPDVPMQ